MAWTAAPKNLLSTREACGKYGLAINTIKRYVKTPFGPDNVTLNRVNIGGSNYYQADQIEALLAYLNSASKGRKAGTSKYKSVKGAVEPAATADVDDGFDEDNERPDSTPPALLPSSADDLYKLLKLPADAPVKLAVSALQKHVINIILSNNVIQTYLDDLQSPDWKSRHSAADKLMALVIPKAKSVEMTHHESEEKKERQDKAISLMQDIKAQISASRASASLNIPKAIPLEIEASTATIERNSSTTSEAVEAEVVEADNV